MTMRGGGRLRMKQTATSAEQFFGKCCGSGGLEKNQL
jgi:hypothetical protein